MRTVLSGRLPLSPEPKGDTISLSTVFAKLDEISSTREVT